VQRLETGIVVHPIAEDWDRYYEGNLGRGNTYRSDAELINEVVSLVQTAEILGYDFVFAPEHHVSPYGLMTNPLQLMTFLAGRTRKINFGTTVLVLPWHHPLRVAEQIALLNNLAPDRRMLLGVGRGVAPFEYEALGVPYDDRRARMDESVEVIRLALTNESFHYDGEVFTIPEVTLRPRPVATDLADCLLVAATSDESLIEGGRRGLGVIYSGQKSTGLTRADVQLLNRVRLAAGFAPTQPVLEPWIFCARSAQHAQERVLQASASLLLDLANNYDQGSWDNHDRSLGYEHFVKDMTAGLDLQRYANMQIWGTPQTCLEQIRALQEETGARNISLQVQWGDITHDEAMASMVLFAEHCMDGLHSIATPMPDWLSIDELSSAPARTDAAPPLIAGSRDIPA
jgi:alkanesulfonate monooxygenase SsuD/methylene tetrahydromethanopterin reductase-like flavin-dependent oxidoreductase (luciferase family)